MAERARPGGDWQASALLAAMHAGAEAPFGTPPPAEVWITNDVSGTAETELEVALAEVGWALELPLVGTRERLRARYVPEEERGELE